MSSTIALPGGQTLTIPDVPTFQNVATLPSTEGTDLNDEGETVLGTVGPSTPFQLTGYGTPGLEAPLVVSAPNITPAPSSTNNLLPYAMLALIAGVVAYAGYMLYKHKAELRGDLEGLAP